MSVNENLPHLSQYKPHMTESRQVGAKYSGIIGCSLTGDITDPSYHEFISNDLHDTPEAAKQAVWELFEKLAAEDMN